MVKRPELRQLALTVFFLQLKTRLHCKWKCAIDALIQDIHNRPDCATENVINIAWSV